MPFATVDPIQEAIELQETFKDDLELKAKYKKYELSHIEANRLQQKEFELRSELSKMRKKNNVTQKELQEKSGLSQQAISRIEVGKDVSPSLKSIVRYLDAIGCDFKIENNKTV